MTVLAATGHRKFEDLIISKENFPEVYKSLIDHIKNINPTLILSGMAIGFDQMIIDAALELNIKFNAIIPFEGQELKWPKYQIDLYNIYLKKAQEIIYVSSRGFANWKFHKRNEYLVDNSESLVAFLKEKQSGTRTLR